MAYANQASSNINQRREDTVSDGHLVFVDYLFFPGAKAPGVNLIDMRLTNWQFVEQLLEHGDIVNDIVGYLRLSEILIKKYGKLLFLDSVLTSIRDVSVDLYYFLLLLKLSKKTSLKDIKKIIPLLKRQWAENYQKNFVISSSPEVASQDIKKYLYALFPDALVEHQEQDSEEVLVSGEWWYYKRWLEQDVKKLLWL